jgi:hypothetical protein
VIESHHHDHEPAQEIERRHSVRPSVGRGGGGRCRAYRRACQGRMDRAHSNHRIGMLSPIATQVAHWDYVATPPTR